MRRLSCDRRDGRNRHRDCSVAMAALAFTERGDDLLEDVQEEDQALRDWAGNERRLRVPQLRDSHSK